MANQFRIPSYVRPGRIEAPENEYPANPVTYVTKKKVANRPFGTEKWREEETFSATLTKKQAKERAKNQANRQEKEKANKKSRRSKNFNFFASVPKQDDFILAAVFTVSPKTQNLGSFTPIIPAAHGPVVMLCTIK